MPEGPSPYISTVARPHPARRDAASYPVRHSIEARFGDMDANGHLNNVALESLHENTRATLNRQVFPEVYNRATRTLRIVTSTIVVHYLREAPWPSVIDTAIGIGHVGRTSFVVATGLFHGGDCVSLCDTVLVLLDDDGPTPIPDDARARLAALRLQVPETDLGATGSARLGS
ncbi:acyl-CoA thioesterase [Mycolicibacterium vaccae]|uniref:acyl-CoA thioesterase n=1 Tax=Mycolicibacterium vaccae TaxID=1810 RepID=UPI003CF0D529